MTENDSSLARITRLVATLVILGIGVVGLAVMARYGRTELPTSAPEKGQAPLVETAEVRLQQQRLDIEVDGVVVPRREIAVAAEVGGRVVQKTDACEAGKYVRKGTLLIEIDPQDYSIEVERLDKELEQAQASLQELDVEETNTQALAKLAEDSLALQRREVARLEKLVSRGIVTESQMDTERRNVLTARNALVTLQNQLRTIGTRRARLQAAKELVQANLKKARLNHRRTKITTPIDGMIVQDLVELDAYLAPGTIVAKIEDVSQCNVRCNLRMDELYWIWNQPRESATPEQETQETRETTGRDYLLLPTPTTVTYKLGDRQYHWDGVLTRYDGIGLDEATRTVPCIVVVAKPSKVREDESQDARSVRGPRALVRGMYVQLTIHARPQTPLLEVPEKAIRPGNRVWRVRGGKLNTIPVRVVSVMGDVAVVRVKGNELMSGDQVVTTPLASVEENMPVRAQAEKKP